MTKRKKPLQAEIGQSEPEAAAPRLTLHQRMMKELDGVVEREWQAHAALPSCWKR
jgi:hypothetical protein